MNYGSSSNQVDWVSYNEQILEEDNEADTLARLHYEAAANQEVVHGGSIPGRKYKLRDQKGKHEQLMNDYFVDNPVFDADNFRRRFRMKRHLLLRLVEDCERSNPYFQRKLDRAHKLGFSSFQKVTVAMRMLAYAYSVDPIDETFHMAETTATEALREFCKTILRLYKDEYLRAPTNADMTRLLDKAEQRGFPGMIGSLDCMHWTWKNCPTACQGSYSGRKHKPTIILEAVDSPDTWIWHAFFCVPGSQNDITVLGRSPLFDNLVQGISPRVRINEKDHYMAYYLVDGIYPKWVMLIQSIKQPRTHQEQLF